MNIRYPLYEGVYRILTNVIVKTCSDIFHTIGQKKCGTPRTAYRTFFGNLSRI